EDQARASRRVQPQGGARSPRGRRTSCTLTARTRAPTKRLSPSRRSSRLRKIDVKESLWMHAGRIYASRGGDRTPTRIAAAPPTPTATPGSCGLLREISQADQVVDRQAEDEHPPDSRPAAMPRLAQQADRFQPAKDFLNALALLLADYIAHVPCGALVDRTG